MLEKTSPNPAEESNLIFMVGFHGTKINNVEEIVQNGFQPAEREDHWLGQGIYFYDRFELAKWWIDRKNRWFGEDENSCAVIQSEVFCSESKFIDLDAPEKLNFFYSQLEDFLEVLSKDGIQLRLRNPTEKDRIKNLCFCVQLFKEVEEVEVVAKTFYKENPSFSPFHKEGLERSFAFPRNFCYTERQICASSNENISSRICVFPKN